MMKTKWLLGIASSFLLMGCSEKLKRSMRNCYQDALPQLQTKLDLLVREYTRFGLSGTATYQFVINKYGGIGKVYRLQDSVNWSQRLEMFHTDLQEIQLECFLKNEGNNLFEFKIYFDSTVSSQVNKIRYSSSSNQIASNSIQIEGNKIHQGIGFASSTSELLYESYEVLDILYETLDFSSISYALEVYVSSDNKRALTLSQERANTIKQYWVNRGAPTENIKAIGMGSQQIASNKTPEGRAKNRIIKLYKLP